MVELITVRLADLVSARLSDGRRVQSYRAAISGATEFDEKEFFPGHS